MHVNYKYVLTKANELTNGTDAKILDYGCGNGEVVEHGLSQGLNMFGTDSFMRTGAKKVLQDKGLLNKVIREIQDKEIPFEDQFFDLVVSNQVLEHVHDLDKVLSEIHRVLKPGGEFLALFPAKDVIREGHYGIPMSHWFPKQSRLRFYYALGLRKLGFGYMKKDKPHKEWAAHAMNYIDKKTFYRPRKEIISSFGKGFQIRFIEDDYCAFRLEQGGRNLASSIVKAPVVNGLGKEAFRRLSSLVILAEKK